MVENLKQYQLAKDFFLFFGNTVGIRQASFLKSSTQIAYNMLGFGELKKS